MSSNGELNHRHVASAENVTKATRFKNCLDKILGFVEEMLPHIPENMYLEQMNNLKDLFQLSPNEQFEPRMISEMIIEFRQMPQVQQEYRLSGYIPKEFIKNMDTVEKLKQKDARGRPTYKLCEFCDKCVSVQYYWKHKKTDECKMKIQNKKLTKSLNSTKTDDYTRCLQFIRAGMGKRIATEFKRCEMVYNFWDKVKPDDLPYWITEEQITQQTKKANSKLRAYAKKKMYWS